jgi:hypothetical protein
MISKQPVLGFFAPFLLTAVRNESSLIWTSSIPAAFSSFSSLLALVLNAFQVLQASIVTLALAAFCFFLGEAFFALASFVSAGLFLAMLFCVLCTSRKVAPRPAKLQDSNYY